MRISCPDCGKPVGADDVSLDRRIAKCRGCDSVFELTELHRPTQAELVTPRQRELLPLPDSLTVSVEDAQLGAEEYRQPASTRGRLRIVRRWFAPSLFFFALFCLAWDSFMFFWFYKAANASLEFKLFGLPHAAIGTLLTYRTLCGFVNRTTIEVTNDTLSIRHGPLPWPGRRALATERIKQLYCGSKLSSSRRGGASTTYEVNALLQDGRTVRLLSGLPDSAQALFIERRVE